MVMSLNPMGLTRFFLGFMCITRALIQFLLCRHTRNQVSGSTFLSDT